MAEVICSLEEKQRGNYMSADELAYKRHQNEVYKAAGEWLMQHYVADGTIPVPGDLLVELHGGMRVCFSYGRCITLESIE